MCIGVQTLTSGATRRTPIHFGTQTEPASQAIRTRTSVAEAMRSSRPVARRTPWTLAWALRCRSRMRHRRRTSAQMPSAYSDRERALPTPKQKSVRRNSPPESRHRVGRRAGPEAEASCGRFAPRRNESNALAPSSINDYASFTPRKACFVGFAGAPGADRLGCARRVPTVSDNDAKPQSAWPFARGDPLPEGWVCLKSRIGAAVFTRPEPT